MYKILITTLLLAPISSAYSSHPDCAGIERWATSMAFVHLKNANITNNKKLDFTKTKYNLFFSVFLLNFVPISDIKSL